MLTMLLLLIMVAKGTRSLTEYGKALLQSPANIKAIANKNAISLEWSAVEMHLATTFFEMMI